MWETLRNHDLTSISRRFDSNSYCVVRVQMRKVRPASCHVHVVILKYIDSSALGDRTEEGMIGGRRTFPVG
ncbi:hypothetical protein VTI28DRAFT_9717 [Corynascus sepedonium]